MRVKGMPRGWDVEEECLEGVLWRRRRVLEGRVVSLFDCLKGGSMMGVFGFFFQEVFVEVNWGIFHPFPVCDMLNGFFETRE